MPNINKVSMASIALVAILLQHVKAGPLTRHVPRSFATLNPERLNIVAREDLILHQVLESLNHRFLPPLFHGNIYVVKLDHLPETVRNSGNNNAAGLEPKTLEGTTPHSLIETLKRVAPFYGLLKRFSGPTLGTSGNSNVLRQQPKTPESHLLHTEKEVLKRFLLLSPTGSEDDILPVLSNNHVVIPYPLAVETLHDTGNTFYITNYS